MEKYKSLNFFSFEYCLHFKIKRHVYSKNFCYYKKNITLTKNNLKKVNFFKQWQKYLIEHIRIMIVLIFKKQC